MLLGSLVSLGCSVLLVSLRWLVLLESLQHLGSPECPVLLVSLQLAGVAGLTGVPGVAEVSVNAGRL